MKRFSLYFLHCCLLLFALAAVAEVRFSIEPEIAVAGQPFYFHVISDSEAPQLESLPPLDNGEWQKDMTRITNQNINGVRQNIRTYVVIPTREGVLKFPEMVVLEGSQKLRTESFDVRVVAPSTATPAGNVRLEEAISGRIQFPADKKSFYAGEWIEVDLVLYIQQGVEAEPDSYPVMTTQKVLFQDFSRENAEAPRFLPARRGRMAELDGKLFNTFVFPTILQATQPGKLELAADSGVAIFQQNSRRGRDDFFDSFFSMSQRRKQQYKVAYTLANPVEIKPLPKLENGVVSLDLVGDYQVTCQLEEKEFQVGAVGKFEILIRGAGVGKEILRAPELKIRDFRVYPPEIIRKNAGETILSYVLIPLKAGSVDFAFRCAWFDIKKGAYQLAECQKTMTVRPPEKPQRDAGLDNPVAMVENPVVSTPTGAGYALKQNLGDGVKMPLFRNISLWFWMVFFAGPLFFIITTWYDRRARKIAANPRLERRKLAGKNRKQLLTAIESAQGMEDLARHIPELTDYLIEQMDLPKGMTLNQIAGKVPQGQPELNELAGFGYGGKTMPERFAVIKQQLLLLLKQLPFWLCLLLTLQISAVTTQEAFRQGNAAYDRGEFLEAAQAYQTGLSKEVHYPELYYNLGSSYEQLMNDPLALYYYENAQRLAPQDRNTLNKVNQIRRKLHLPEKGRMDNPLRAAGSLRDSLRPDQWLMIFAVSFSLVFVVAGLRKRIGQVLAWWFGGALLAVAILALLSVDGQRRGSYNPDRGMVTSGAAEVYSLPSANAGEVELTLPGGTPVTILERRSDFTLIKFNQREGWVKNQAIQ